VLPLLLLLTVVAVVVPAEGCDYVIQVLFLCTSTLHVSKGLFSLLQTPGVECSTSVHDSEV
jgi:hypothetical protein